MIIIRCIIENNTKPNQTNMSIVINNRTINLNKHRNRKLRKLETTLQFDPELGRKMPGDIIYLIIEMSGAGKWRDPDGTSLDWRRTALGKWRKPGECDWENGGYKRTPKLIFKFHKDDERLDVLAKHMFFIVTWHNIHPDRHGVELGFPYVNPHPPKRYLIDVRIKTPCYIRGFMGLDIPYCVCTRYPGGCFARPRGTFRETFGSPNTKNLKI